MFEGKHLLVFLFGKQTVKYHTFQHLLLKSRRLDVDGSNVIYKYINKHMAILDQLRQLTVS